MNSAVCHVEPIARSLSVGPNTVSAVSTSGSQIQRLTAALATGDESAFCEFHASYFDRLFRYELVILRGDEAAARDALQETFLRVARHARRFDTAEEFWGWLTALARSAALDLNRKQSRYWAALKKFFSGRSEDEFAHNAFDSAQNELRDSLNRAIAQLDPIDRQLIEGKYFDQASVIDLAQQTNLTAKAVESRLHRARTQLRTTLQKGKNDENA